MSPLAEQHVQRCLAHVAAGNRLAAAGDEWAAVAYFYAAYRAARAALLQDPRLDDDRVARRIHPRLSASSRHVDHHQGGPARPPGLNEVVRLLYPDIAAPYVLLHIKSVEVRYGAGLTAASPSEIGSLTRTVIGHFESAGLIEAP